jgi:hypothetical protein
MLWLPRADRTMCQLGLYAFQQTNAGALVRGSRLMPVHVFNCPFELAESCTGSGVVEASGWACRVYTQQ